MKSDFYNREGYADPTVGKALRNLERKERKSCGNKKRGECRTKPSRPMLTDYETDLHKDYKYRQEEMANAIIIRAVKDWRKAARILKKHPNDLDAQRTVRETEQFFLSDTYKTLTTYDGQTLLNRLKSELQT